MAGQLIGCSKLLEDEIPRGEEEVTSNTVNPDGITEQSSGMLRQTSRSNRFTVRQDFTTVLCYRNDRK